MFSLFCLGLQKMSSQSTRERRESGQHLCTEDTKILAKVCNKSRATYSKGEEKQRDWMNMRADNV